MRISTPLSGVQPRYKRVRESRPPRSLTSPLCTKGPRKDFGTHGRSAAALGRLRCDGGSNFAKQYVGDLQVLGHKRRFRVRFEFDWTENGEWHLWWGFFFFG